MSDINGTLGVPSTFPILKTRWYSIPIILFVIAAIVYLLFPSQQYDPDVLPELQIINSLQPTFESPGHMLYSLTGVALYKVWLILGNEGDSMHVMQLFNALCGAASIAILFLILCRLKVHTLAAIAISVACGLSYAFWTHTSDAFFIIPAALFALLALLLGLLLRDMEASRQKIVVGVFLGIAISFAMLFYQTNALIIPAVLVASLPTNRDWKQWFNHWIIIAVTVGLVAGGIWLWQATQVLHLGTLSEIINWFLGGHGGMSRGLWRRENVPLVSTSVFAWVATIVPLYEGLRLSELFDGQINGSHLGGQLALVVSIFAVLFTTYLLVRRWRHGIAHSSIWLALALWFALPGLAVLWFDRAEVKLWMIPLFTLWIVLAIGLNAGLTMNRRLARVSWICLISLPVMIGLGNFTLAVWPAHTNVPLSVQKARTALTHLTSDDLMINASFSWVSHLAYLCTDCQIASLLSVAQQIPVERLPEIKSMLFQHIENTWQAGGHVYVLEYFVKPDDPIWSSSITPFTGLEPLDFSGFNQMVAWQVGDETVWELRPTP